MFAGQVGPSAAYGNLAEWAEALGLVKLAQWLSTKAPTVLTAMGGGLLSAWAFSFFILRKRKKLEKGTDALTQWTLDLQPLLELVFKENESPFKITKADDQNMSIVQVGITNSTPRIIKDCYVRIEKIKTDGQPSLWKLFDEAKLFVKAPAKSTISIGAFDTAYVPIAQVHKITRDLNSTGIELCCYSTEEHVNLDPHKKHLITIRASAEIGQPIEKEFRLWIDEVGSLRMDEAPCLSMHPAVVLS